MYFVQEYSNDNYMYIVVDASAIKESFEKNPRPTNYKENVHKKENEQ